MPNTGALGKKLIVNITSEHNALAEIDVCRESQTDLDLLREPMLREKDCMGLGNNGVDELAVDIGQAKISTGIAVG